MADVGIRTNTTKAAEVAGETPLRNTGTNVEGDKRAADSYINNPESDPANTNVLNVVETDNDAVNARLISMEDLFRSQQSALDKIVELLEEQSEALKFAGVVRDGQGEWHGAKVTHRGQLITAPLDFSTITTVLLDTINTPFNLSSPQPDKQFVVTDIIIAGDRFIGVNDASISVYEANSFEAVLGAGESSISLDVVKQSVLPLTGLNLIVSEGKWLTAVTNDVNISINIAGYYVDTIRE